MKPASHLFLGVSTALTISAPFVPGSFTYSSLGGGACDTCGVPGVLFRLSSTDFGTGRGGLSSDLLPWKAFVMIRGIKREEREDWEETTDGVVSGSSGTLVVEGVMDELSLGEEFGRMVDVCELLERKE
jgi:hypothetical protein